MRRSTTKVVAVTAVAAAALAACSSGSSAPSTGSSSSAAAGKTITVGLLVDNSGLASSGQKHVEDGMKAAMSVVAKDGYKIKYVVADTQSNPATALSAAQKLVQQDHVLAVIAHSALFFAAAPYLTKQGVPVIGAAQDGPEWTTSKNMFAVYGALHTEKVTATFGKLMKLLGVTTVGALGYSISPSSAEAAKASGVSAQAAGLKVGYINSKFPFGSTDVGPVALAMKNHGVDGLTPDVDPNTSFALIQALKNLGSTPKVVLPIGYGGDLLQAGPGTLKEAQNVYFTIQYQPVELNTDATKAFVSALQATGGTTAPGLPTYDGYASILLLVQGLKAAGANPTQASLITALSGIHSFNPGGLYGDHPLDVNDRVNNGNNGNCVYVMKLVGSKFEQVPGAEPICGEILPGKTVTP